MKLKLEIEADSGEEEKVEAALRAEDLVYALRELVSVVQRAKASLATHNQTLDEIYTVLHNLEVAHLILRKTT